MGLPIVSLFYLPVISLIKRYTGRTFNPFGNIKEILREEMSLKVTLFSFVFKVVRYSFLGPIPPKFEHKLRRHKQSFGEIATTVVLDEDENLL